MKTVVRGLRVGALEVLAFPTRAEMGSVCAAQGGVAIREAIASKGSANVLFASAPSQMDLYASLIMEEGIDWGRVHAFQLDEYLDLAADAPQCLGGYLRTHFLSRVPVGFAYYLDGNSGDPARECERYSNLLCGHAPDVAFLGIGTNGHLAFNDPGVADFSDPASVKVVPQLDEECRSQQVADGWFKHISEVPTRALTLTIPALMAAKNIFALSPGTAKRDIIRSCVEGPIGTQCPATVMRTHPAAKLFLDYAAADAIMLSWRMG